MPIVIVESIALAITITVVVALSQVIVKHLRRVKKCNLLCCNIDYTNDEKKNDDDEDDPVIHTDPI